MPSKRLNIPLDDDLDQRFRNAVGRLKGAHKGAITEAVKEAIEDWLRKHD